MTLDAAIAQVLSGGQVGEPDATITAAGPDGIAQLIQQTLDHPIGKEALSSQGGYNASRFRRIFQIVAQCGTADVSSLKPFLSSPRPAVRHAIIELLIAKGDDSAAALLTPLLARNDEDFTSTMEAIAKALRANRATPVFRSTAFDAIAADLTSDAKFLVYPFAQSPAEFLLALDRPRALPLVLSSAVLNPKNVWCDHVLRLIQSNKLELDDQRLLEIAHSNDISKSYSLIRLLGQRSLGPEILKTLLKHPARETRAAAFEAILLSKMIDHFNLTPPQRKNPTLYALAVLNQILGMTDSDGLQSALENISKNDWKQAVELLTQSNAPQTATTLEKALANRGTDEAELRSLENTLSEDKEQIHSKLENHLSSLKII